jgi:putative PIN family toxin of toxin-antitoxin system
LNTPLVVLDTMIVVGAIMGTRSGACAQTLDAVATGGVSLAISDDQLSELVRVMGYEDVEAGIHQPVRAFEIALDIGTMGTMYHPHRLDWPSLRDPRDGWIFDLAYTAGADYIVTFDRAVGDAARTLGFEVLKPEELLEVLGW